MNEEVKLVIDVGPFLFLLLSLLIIGGVIGRWRK